MKKKGLIGILGITILASLSLASCDNNALKEEKVEVKEATKSELDDFITTTKTKKEKKHYLKSFNNVESSNNYYVVESFTEDEENYERVFSLVKGEYVLNKAKSSTITLETEKIFTKKEYDSTNKIYNLTLYGINGEILFSKSVKSYSISYNQEKTNSILYNVTYRDSDYKTNYYKFYEIYNEDTDSYSYKTEILEEKDDTIGLGFKKYGDYYVKEYETNYNKIIYVYDNLKKNIIKKINLKKYDVSFVLGDYLYVQSREELSSDSSNYDVEIVASVDDKYSTLKYNVTTTKYSLKDESFNNLDNFKYLLIDDISVKDTKALLYYCRINNKIASEVYSVGIFDENLNLIANTNILSSSSSAYKLDSGYYIINSNYLFDNNLNYIDNVRLIDNDNLFYISSTAIDNLYTIYDSNGNKVAYLPEIYKQSNNNFYTSSNGSEYYEYLNGSFVKVNNQNAINLGRYSGNAFEVSKEQSTIDDKTIYKYTLRLLSTNEKIIMYSDNEYSTYNFENYYYSYNNYFRFYNLRLYSDVDLKNKIEYIYNK